MEDSLYSELQLALLDSGKAGKIKYPLRLKGGKKKNARKRFRRLLMQCKMEDGKLLKASKEKTGAVVNGEKVECHKKAWRQVVKRSEVERFLTAFHDSEEHGGHSGIYQTVAKIKAAYYLPKAFHLVSEHIKKCPVCIVHKSSVAHSKLKHIIAESPMERLMLDHPVDYSKCPVTGHR